MVSDLRVEERHGLAELQALAPVRIDLAHRDPLAPRSTGRSGWCRAAGEHPSRPQTARSRGSLELVQAGPGDVARHLQALFALHAARWSLRGETGVLGEEPVRRFHAEAARALANAGTLWGYRLVVNGKDAAVWHGFEHLGRLFFYLGGFDPGLRQANPGTVVLAHAVEEAIRAGVRWLDLLRGREPYKYDWGAEDRPAVRRVLAPSHVRAWGAAEEAGRVRS